MDRRTFLRNAGSGLLAMAVRPDKGTTLFASTSATRAKLLRLAILAPRATDARLADALRGIELGMAEAVRAAALLGWRVESRTIDVAPGSEAAAVAAASEFGAAVALGGFGTSACRALAEAAGARGIVFLNVGCRADELRTNVCSPRMFHIEASDAMYAAAATLHRVTAAAPVDPTARAVLWHASLERFGAQQLNDRYRSRFGAAMPELAWAGWMAVKVAWEAALRVSSSEADAIASYLLRASTRFDGHKGWPLSFRSLDHQLRQPLYIVNGTQVVAEVPARSGGAEAALETLDRLAAQIGETACSAR